MTDNELPSRLRTHYCRACGLLFKRAASAHATSPHALAWIHRQHEHDRSLAEYASCSRYCEQVAQPEEIEHARRLYGAGIPHATEAPSALKSYAELFPEDD